MFKLANLIVAALAAGLMLAGQTNAIADNPGQFFTRCAQPTTDSVLVDACNGSNHYDVGHSCAFQESQGGTRVRSARCSVLTERFKFANTTLVAF